MTAQGAIWRAQLTEAERAALGRADGDVAGARPDVLVEIGRASCRERVCAIV